LGIGQNLSGAGLVKSVQRGAGLLLGNIQGELGSTAKLGRRMRVGLLAAALTISAQTICLAQTERALRPIKFDAPTLAPMAYTQFCARYVDECRAWQPSFRGGRIKLTNLRWSELVNVNSSLNSSIRAEPSKVADHEWLLSPGIKNATIIASQSATNSSPGGPARAVLLSEVATFSGQHHVVVVVRTNIGNWCWTI
jgi:predicted transglutaminase-like cysteine proteinase